MKNSFKNFLVECGYKEITPSGKLSTVYQYLKSIEKVLAWEGITWTELAENISNVCDLYDKGGEKEKQGSISHDTVINALKSFKRFVANN